MILGQFVVSVLTVHIMPLETHVKISGRSWAALLIVIALGAVLRFHNLGVHGIWADEMFTLLMAGGDADRQLGPCFRRECDGNPIIMDVERFRRDVLAGGMTVQPAAVVRAVYRYEPSHPPLYYMAANLSIGVFGVSDFALRLPSVLFGTLTIPVIFLLGKRLQGAGTGLLAASMFAFAPYEVYFGQEARMFSMVLFLSVLSTWVLLEISDDSRPNRRIDWRWWGAYILTAVAGMYTIFLFLLMFGVHFVIVIERYRKDRVFLRNWLLAVGVCGLLFAPFLLARFLNPVPPPPAALNNLLADRKSLAQLITTASGNMLDLVWVESRSYKWLTIVLTMIGTFVVVRRRIVWPVAWMMATPAAVVAIDLLMGTAASSVNRYYILAGPGLYLLIALGISVIRPITLSFGLAGLIVLHLALGGYSTVEGRVYPRREFKEAASFISQTTKPGDALILISTPPPRVLGMNLAYYMATPAKMTMLQAEDEKDIDWMMLAERLRGHDRVVITTVYSWHKKSPDFPRQVTENLPFLEFVEQRSYRGLNVFSFRQKVT